VNALEFINSIDLLLQRDLLPQARDLYQRVRQEQPHLFSVEEWGNIGRQIPQHKREGYRYKRVVCPVCGSSVASNWLSRHRCKTVVGETGVPTPRQRAIAALLRAEGERRNR
jgi:hypothetical protein